MRSAPPATIWYRSPASRSSGTTDHRFHPTTRPARRAMASVSTLRRARSHRVAGPSASTIRFNMLASMGSFARSAFHLNPYARSVARCRATQPTAAHEPSPNLPDVHFTVRRPHWMASSYVSKQRSMRLPLIAPMSAACPLALDVQPRSQGDYRRIHGYHAALRLQPRER